MTETEPTTAPTAAEDIQDLLDCSRYGEVEEVQELLGRGVDANSVDGNGRSALFFACANGHVEVTRALLAKGADPNQANAEGNTSLHWACLNGHAEVVRALIEAGGNVSSVNSAQLTPVDEALQKDHKEVLEVIEQLSVSTVTLLLIQKVAFTAPYTFVCPCTTWTALGFKPLCDRLDPDFYRAVRDRYPLPSDLNAISFKILAQLVTTVYDNWLDAQSSGVAGTATTAAIIPTERQGAGADEAAAAPRGGLDGYRPGIDRGAGKPVAFDPQAQRAGAAVYQQAANDGPDAFSQEQDGEDGLLGELEGISGRLTSMADAIGLSFTTALIAGGEAGSSRHMRCRRGRAPWAALRAGHADTESTDNDDAWRSMIGRGRRVGCGRPFPGFVSWHVGRSRDAFDLKISNVVPRTSRV
ncbi:hypothetical protein CYMTET_31360 [Cymbomonas tetramitiformis]|uniref:Uncharacterized protein n=1 Tax=Cymbomonas tetramitiformis TaxID=36881 RepID=A0AAE0KTA7_9CHLO|nr:hypothetical protein CYMTET_31360 [Cymbomonas tetramitiformis]